MNLPSPDDVFERNKEIERRVLALAAADKKRHRNQCVKALHEVPTDELLPILRIRLLETRRRAAFKRLGTFLIERATDESVKLLIEFDRVTRRMTLTNLRLLATSNNNFASEFMKRQIQSGNRDRKYAALKAIAEARRTEGVLLLCNFRFRRKQAGNAIPEIDG